MTTDPYSSVYLHFYRTKHGALWGTLDEIRKQILSDNTHVFWTQVAEEWQYVFPYPVPTGNL